MSEDRHCKTVGVALCPPIACYRFSQQCKKAELRRLGQSSSALNLPSTPNTHNHRHRLGLQHFCHQYRCTRLVSPGKNIKIPHYVFMKKKLLVSSIKKLKCLSFFSPSYRILPNIMIKLFLTLLFVSKRTYVTPFSIGNYQLVA